MLTSSPSSIYHAKMTTNGRQVGAKRGFGKHSQGFYLNHLIRLSQPANDPVYPSTETHCVPVRSLFRIDGVLYASYCSHRGLTITVPDEELYDALWVLTDRSPQNCVQQIEDWLQLRFGKRLTCEHLAEYADQHSARTAQLSHSLTLDNYHDWCQQVGLERLNAL